VDESQIYFDVESASGCPEVPFKLTVGTEIVNVIGVVGNTFTVQRGAEGTTPQGHPEGALVQNRWTAGTYEDLWDDVERLQGDVGAHKENTTDAHDIDKHFDATPEDNVHGLAGAVIVDAGSNENGSWVRFGNGLQICWHYFGPVRLDIDELNAGIYRSALQEHEFPVPFIESPATAFSQSTPGNFGTWVTGGGGALWRYRAFRITSGTDININYIGMIAIGRWK
jgi:hypothetical protein